MQAIALKRAILKAHADIKQAETTYGKRSDPYRDIEVRLHTLQREYDDMMATEAAKQGRLDW